MIKNLKQKIKNILSGAGVDINIKLETPPDPDMGDIAFPCFEYAQKHGEDPTEVAQHIAELVDGKHGLGVFEDVQAVGPYVNFFLNLQDVADDVIPTILSQEEGYGFTNEGQKQRILMEYPSPNTHKRFHVGHLRNVCIGNALKELYKRNGYEVSIVNYVNDFGVHVAKSLWGIINLYDGEIPEEDTQSWLGQVYSEASRKIKNNEKLKQEVEEIMKKITDKDPEIYDLFEKTRDISLEVFDDIFDELKVNHDKVYFESDLRDKGQEIVEELLEEGIAETGEKGAIIVDLEEHDLNVALIRKSNGEGVYLTSDLALAEAKHEDYPAIDKSIHITGTEQDLHFKQLFKILELYGADFDMEHVGYGLVHLPGGQMSSREGKVVLYEDLKQNIFDRLKEETESRHEDWDEKKIEEKARKMTLAVAKFELQKHESHKDVTFDIEQATNFEGYSAPYVLYVIARISSLEDKAEVGIKSAESIDYSFYSQPEERELIMKVSKLSEVLTSSLENYNTSNITRYCFDLSKAFNNYYSEHSIINETNEELTKARLALCLAVKQVLKNALDVLTIDTLEEM
ncbi:MAG: arginine--tRNA ligase [Candidatus Magasanikbacteria bacterium]